GRTLRVLLNKSSSDLGFSLEGGRGSSQGDRALTVKKVFLGGPVEQVFPGDEILEVKGHSLRGLRRLEAWNWIKRLPSGPVEVLLHRKHRL
ncbi:IL16 protein, partial [Amia calva]|nr:IL16 protein [Amia calva]